MNKIGFSHVKELTEFIQESGVAVFECNIVEKKRELIRLGVKLNGILHGQLEAGYYISKTNQPQADLSSFPMYSIFINREIDNDAKYSFLLHEYGHHLCDIRHCGCMVPDTFHPVAEAHAHAFVIGRLKEKSFPLALLKYVKAVMKLILQYSNTNYWDAKLASELFCQVLKKERPLEAISKEDLNEIEKAIEDIKSLMEFHSILDEKSSNEICAFALSLLPVGSDTRYIKLVEDMF